MNKENNAKRNQAKIFRIFHAHFKAVLLPVATLSKTVELISYIGTRHEIGDGRL